MVKVYGQCIMVIMMCKLLKNVFMLLVSTTSCDGPADIYSSFDFERSELLNRMRKIERIYIWNH